MTLLYNCGGRERWRLTWTGKPASNLTSLLKKKKKQLSGANSQQLWCGFITFFYLFIAILCCFINIIKHFYMYSFLFLLFFLILFYFCEFFGLMMWTDYPLIHFVYSRAVPTEVIERILKPGLLDPRCSRINVVIPNPLDHHPYCVTTQSKNVYFCWDCKKKKERKWGFWTLNILRGRHGDRLDCSHRLNCLNLKDLGDGLSKRKTDTCLTKTSALKD